MGVNCWSEVNSRKDYDTTQVTLPKKSNRKIAATPIYTDTHPVDVNAKTIDLNSSYSNEQEVNIDPLDLAIYGRADPTNIKRSTRIVKKGKKVRKFNYNHLEISDQELKYSLKNVAEIYKQLGPFHLKPLVDEGLMDKNIKRHLYSNCVMAGGGTYTGQIQAWSRGLKDGIGYIIYPDGSLFEGVFESNDTVKGRYIFTNGCVYEGQMKNHKMHGHGVLKCQDEVLYEGHFENGEQVDQKKNIVTSADNLTPLPKGLNLVPHKSVQFNL